MAGPARAGALIYAIDVEHLAHFYEVMLSMRRLVTTEELVVLESADIQLVIHAIPPDIARTVVVTSPPEPRQQSAIRFFFTVPSISDARATASEIGGAVYTQQWPGTGFVMCNGHDPEGNIFQIRELKR